MMQDTFHLVGYASGLAGADVQCGDGPLVLQNSSYLSALTNMGIPIHWDKVVHASHPSSSLRIDESVRMLCETLANTVSALIHKQQFFSVLGGDHSCAIGTWSGVYDALHGEGEMGLIWLDAHMDSHTPETSLSGRIHGMPLASLMGYGYPTLTTILHDDPKLKPENVCLIGVRSFEHGEALLLKRLNVRIYFMEEVKERGFITVLREAVNHVSQHTIAYGLSIDLDSIDPKEAPGVDVPEPDGIAANDFCDGLSDIISDPKCIATEIVEFDPSRDHHHMTEKLIVDLLKIIVKGQRLNGTR